MVALWLPNAASESLEKKIVHSGPSVPCEPEHRHRPYHKRFTGTCTKNYSKTDSTARTFGAKRCVWIPRKKNEYILAHPYPVNLSTGTDLATRDSQAPASMVSPPTPVIPGALPLSSAGVGGFLVPGANSAALSRACPVAT